MRVFIMEPWRLTLYLWRLITEALGDASGLYFFAFLNWSLDSR
jgi:hypothetical protein